MVERSFHGIAALGAPAARRAEAGAIAEQFAAAEAGAFLYRPAEKAWRAWDGAAWRPDTTGRAREKIREVVAAALAEGADAALRRRLCLVPFATRPARPDRGLEARLRAEWPAILAWMIEGCLAWQAEGLGRPAAVERAGEDYFASQDVVGHFLHEMCELGPGKVERAGALYAAWVGYARAAGEAPGSQRLMAMALERAGMVRERTRHARLYRGLRLLTQAERDAG